MRIRARQLRPRPVLRGLSCPPLAPFCYQPTRQGLQGLASLGAGAGSSYAPPTGAGSGAGATVGASQGAAIGTAIVPGIGTAIGAVIGAIGGAIAGALGKKDPEQYNFDQAVAIWQQNPDAVYAIGNKYLPLAGLFDLNIKTNIPIYKKFGHMGEEAFVNALVNQIYSAAQNGKITANDSALSIFNNIIQPWINSWGYGPMQDPHADLINRLMIGMIIDYVTGAWRNSWYARGGDFPASFSKLPNFALATPTAAPAAASTAAPTPTTAMPPSPQGVSLWGTALVAGTPGTLVTPTAQGTPATWQLTSDGRYLFNGTVATTAPASQANPTGVGTLAVLYAGQVYAYNSDGQNYVWNGTTFQPTSAPSPPGNVQSQIIAAQAAVRAAVAAAAASSSTTPAVTTPPPAVVVPPTTIPSNTPATTATQTATVGTTSTGQTVTQADLQALVGQIAAQGATAQQAYASALQTLQSNGVQPTAAVQSAVQQAVADTPPPTAATAGLDLSSSSGSWLGIAAIAATFLFATARPARSPRRRRSSRR